jgi:hypothetical protein
MTLKPTLNGERQKASSNRGCRIPSTQTATTPTGKQKQQQHANKQEINEQVRSKHEPVN